MVSPVDTRVTCPYNGSMNIEYHCKYDDLVNPDDLKSHPKNANMHPEEQIEALSRFIRVSGFRQPVTVSKRSDFIVAGHARKVAAKRVGCKVPVVYQDFDSEVDEIAYLLADNRLAELAITDDEKLQNNLDFLDGNEFELGDIGFDLDIDLGLGDSQESGDGSDSPAQERAAMDEVRVFVLPERRMVFFEALKSFVEENGESSIRWQKV